MGRDRRAPSCRWIVLYQTSGLRAYGVDYTVHCTVLAVCLEHDTVYSAETVDTPFFDRPCPEPPELHFKTDLILAPQPTLRPLGSPNAASLFAGSTAAAPNPPPQETRCRSAAGIDCSLLLLVSGGSPFIWVPPTTAGVATTPSTTMMDRKEPRVGN